MVKGDKRRSGGEEKLGVFEARAMWWLMQGSASYPAEKRREALVPLESQGSFFR